MTHSNPLKEQCQEGRNNNRNFLSLLDATQYDELGPINEEWFVDFVSNYKEKKQKRNDTFPRKTCTVPLPRHVALQPCNHSPLGASPCLFSPNNPVSARKDTRFHETPGYNRPKKRHNACSPSTPGSGGCTPCHTQAAMEDPVSHNWTPFANPCPDSGWLNKRVWKTPGSARVSPMSMRKSLGVNLEDSLLSWSSSMATPPANSAHGSLGKHVTDKNNRNMTQKEFDEMPLGAARMLFSPGSDQLSQDTEDDDVFNNTVEEEPAPQYGDMPDSDRNKCSHETRKIEPAIQNTGEFQPISCLGDELAGDSHNLLTGVKLENVCSEPLELEVSFCTERDHKQFEECMEIQQGLSMDRADGQGKDKGQADQKDCGCDTFNFVALGIEQRTKRVSAPASGEVHLQKECTSPVQLTVSTTQVFPMVDPSSEQLTKNNKLANIDHVDCIKNGKGEMLRTNQDSAKSSPSVHTAKEKTSIPDHDSTKYVSGVSGSQCINIISSDVSCDLQDTLSIFNTPPARANIRKKLAPKRRKKSLVGKVDNKDVLPSETDISKEDQSGQSQTSTVTSTDSKFEHREIHMKKDPFESKCSSESTPLSLPFEQATEVSTSGDTQATAVIIPKYDPSDPEISFKTPMSKKIRPEIKEQERTGPVVSPVSTTLFTQVSPGSLSAMCSAADLQDFEKMNILHVNVDAEKAQDSKTHSLGYHMPGAHMTLKSEEGTISDYNIQDASESDVSVLLKPANETKPRTDIEKSSGVNTNVADGDDNHLFSQISPNAMDAILKVANTAEVPQTSRSVIGDAEYDCSCSTPVRWEFEKAPTACELSGQANSPTVSAQVNTMSVCKSVPTCNEVLENCDVSWANMIRTSTMDLNGSDNDTTNRLERNVACGIKVNCDMKASSSETPVSSKSLVSIRARKAKRFSYPSSSQITDTCPRRVFNFHNSTDSKKCEARKSPENLQIELKAETRKDNSDVEKTTPVPCEGESSGILGLKGRKIAEQHKRISPVKPVPRPQWRRYSTGFTSLTSYNKSSSPASKINEESSTIQGTHKHPALSCGADNLRIREIGKTGNLVTGASDKTSVILPRKESKYTRSPFECNTEKLPVVVSPSLSNDAFQALMLKQDSNGFNQSSVSKCDEPKEVGLKPNVMSPNKNWKQRESRVAKSPSQKIQMKSTVGFQTASNRAIEVTAESLSKAQNIADQCQDENCFHDANVTKLQNSSIQFHGQDNEADTRELKVKNKTIKNESVQMDVVTIKSGPVENVNLNTIPHEDIVNNICVAQGSEPKTLGFSSASGKKICVTKAGMERARSMISEVEQEYQQLTEEATKELESNSFKTRLTDAPKVKSFGFKSASGKALHVSESAVKKASAFISDVKDVVNKEILEADRINLSTETRKDSLTEPKKVIIQPAGCLPGDGELGFQSASGKKLGMDPALLAKYRQWMDELEPLGDGCGVAHTEEQKSKCEKDYSNRPKGFHPFKAPKRMQLNSIPDTWQDNTKAANVGMKASFMNNDNKTNDIHTRSPDSKDNLRAGDKDQSPREIIQRTINVSLDAKTGFAQFAEHGNKSLSGNTGLQSPPPKKHSVGDDFDDSFEELTNSQLTEMTGSSCAVASDPVKVLPKTTDLTSTQMFEVAAITEAFLEQDVTGSTQFFAGTDKRGDTAVEDVGLSSFISANKSSPDLNKCSMNISSLDGNGEHIEVQKDDLIVAQANESTLTAESKINCNQDDDDQSVPTSQLTENCVQGGNDKRISGILRNEEKSKGNQYGNDQGMSGSSLNVEKSKGNQYGNDQGMSGSSLNVEKSSCVQDENDQGVSGSQLTEEELDDSIVMETVFDDGGTFHTSVFLEADENPHEFQGFRLASGKQVSVSQHSLAHAELKVQEMMKDETNFHICGSQSKALDYDPNLKRDDLMGGDTSLVNTVWSKGSDLVESNIVEDIHDKDNSFISASFFDNMSFCENTSPTKESKAEVNEETFHTEATEAKTIAGQLSGFLSVNGKTISASADCMEQAMAIMNSVDSDWDTDLHDNEDPSKTLEFFKPGEPQVDISDGSFRTLQHNANSQEHETLNTTETSQENKNSTSLKTTDVFSCMKIPVNEVSEMPVLHREDSVLDAGVSSGKNHVMPQLEKADISKRDGASQPPCLKINSSTADCSEMPKLRKEDILEKNKPLCPAEKMPILEKELLIQRPGSQEITDAEVNAKLHDKSTIVADPPALSSCIGFSTARGNKIQVSDEALKLAASLLQKQQHDQDYDDSWCVDSTCKNLMPEHNETDKVNSIGGLGVDTTGSQNVVLLQEIGSGLQVTARHDLEGEECGIQSPHVLDEPKNHQTEKDVETQLQSKDRGAHVTQAGEYAHSDKASYSVDQLPVELAKHTNVETSDMSNGDAQNGTSDVPESNNNTYMGFKTGSGRKVQVSVQALEQAKQLLRENEKLMPNQHCAGHNEQTSCHTGFKIARGGNVTVTAVALEKAGKFLQGADDLACQPSGTSELLQNEVSCFQASSIKGEHVSHATLVQATDLLKEGVFSVKSNFVEEDREPLPMTFQTGEGKKIGNSDAALKETKLMSDRESSLCVDRNYKDMSEAQMGSFRSNLAFGFKTAGGHDVSVSDEALQQAKQMFDTTVDNFREECRSDAVNEKADQDTKLIKYRQSKNPGKVCGFQTAGGKTVQISDKALEEACKTLREETVNLKDKVKRRRFQNQKSKMESKELTSGIPACEVSEKRQDQVYGGVLQHRAHTDSEQNVSKGCSGFQTAAGRTVDISRQALDQAQNLLNNVTAADDSIESVVPDRMTKRLGFQGFHTAGGRHIGVSGEALKKAQQIFKEETCVSEKMDTQVSGFTRAEEKSVVCGEAVQSDARLEPEFKSGSNSLRTVTGFAGFSTASGRSIKVSEKAISEARKALGSEIEENEALHNSSDTFTVGSGSAHIQGKAVETAVGQDSDTGGESSCNRKSDSISFSTDGSKGSVKMSDETLQKTGAEPYIEHDLETPKVENSVKREFKQINFDGSTATMTASNFMGFQTATGNTVQICEKSLLKARKFLQDDADESPMNELRGEEMGPDQSKSTGFQTAGGNPVNISEKALDEARNMLSASHADIDCEESEFMCRRNNESFAERAQTGRATSDGDTLIEMPSSSSLHNLNTSGTGVQAESILDVSFETSESTKALLADGSFEGFSVVPSTPFSSRTSTPRESEKHVPRTTQNMSSNEGVTSLQHKEWMVPVKSTPEECFQDHQHCNRTLSGIPLISGPDDEYARVPGPARYSRQQWLAENTDRHLFASNFCHQNSKDAPRIQQENTHKIPIKGTAHSNSAGFVTPYKKVEKEEAPDKGPLGTGCMSTPVRGQLPRGQSTKRPASPSKFVPPQRKRLRSDYPAVKIIDTEAQDGLSSPQKEQMALPGTSDTSSNTSNHIPAEISRAACSSDVVTRGRLKAKVAQAQGIKDKKSQVIRPIAGKLWLKKGSGPRQSLRDAVGGCVPEAGEAQELRACGIRDSTMTVNASNAEEFTFEAIEYFGEGARENIEGIRVGDGSLLILDDQGWAGKQEFCNAFLGLPGVDPGLISREWVYNHYRWIVWKLAAMEVAFPAHFGGRCLTPDQVMFQLKYRYDREVDRSQRSALKKIYERDDTCAKRLVLCVSSILHNTPTPRTDGNKASTAGRGSPALQQPSTAQPHHTCQLVLTDGWYAIKALPDAPLTRLVYSKKLQVGDKLCICGAELMGSQEAAPPLQAPADVMLKLSANSTRRARWDARLGYERTLQPFAVPFSSLYTDGGVVGCVDVIVTRVYPIQYFEKLQDGSSIMRNERAEEKAARQFEGRWQKKMEELYSTIQKEFEQKEAAVTTLKKKESSRGKKLTTKDIGSLQDGADIYRALQEASDPSAIESCLTECQCRSLMEYRQEAQMQRQMEMRAEIQSRLQDLQSQESCARNVSALLKVRLAGCATADVDSGTSTMLSVWRPREDIQELLTEGKRFKIYSLTVAEARGRHSSCKVAMTATKTTRYQEIPADDNFRDLVYEPREVTSLGELQPGFSPACGELDLIGVVIHISSLTSFDKHSGDSGQVQRVYLADTWQDVCAVKFWGGLAAYCVEELVQVGTLVSFSNLQWRPCDRDTLPTATATDLSKISLNPAEPHLKAAINKMKSRIKDTRQFVETMKDKLHEMFSIRSSGHQTPQPSMSYTGLPHTKHAQSSMIYPVKRGLCRPQAVSAKPSAFSGQGHISAVGSSSSFGKPQLVKPTQDSPIMPGFHTSGLRPVSPAGPKLPDRKQNLAPSNAHDRGTPSDKPGTASSTVSIAEKHDQSVLSVLHDNQQNTKSIDFTCNENTIETVRTPVLLANPKESGQTDPLQGEHRHPTNPFTPTDSMYTSEAKYTPGPVTGLPECNSGTVHPSEIYRDVFDTSPMASQDESPAVAKQRASQQAKAKRLELYGEAPPLLQLNSPIPVVLRKGFQAPRRSEGTVGARHNFSSQTVEKNMLASVSDPSKQQQQQQGGVESYQAVVPKSKSDETIGRSDSPGEHRKQIKETKSFLNRRRSRVGLCRRQVKCATPSPTTAPSKESCENKCPVLGPMPSVSKPSAEKGYAVDESGSVAIGSKENTKAGPRDSCPNLASVDSGQHVKISDMLDVETVSSPDKNKKRGTKRLHSKKSPVQEEETKQHSKRQSLRKTKQK